MRKYLITFESTVSGIPCQIGVLDYEPLVKGRYSGAPENCYPDEGGYGEYDVLDRRGRRALWLEKKITDRDEECIQEDIYNHMEGW